MVPEFLWANEATGDTPWLTLVNFGVLGLLVYFLVFRPKVHTDAEVQSLKDQIAAEAARADKAEAENKRLHTLVEEMVIPALSRSTDLIARSLEDRGKRDRADG